MQDAGTARTLWERTSQEWGALTPQQVPLHVPGRIPRGVKASYHRSVQAQSVWSASWQLGRACTACQLVGHMAYAGVHGQPRPPPQKPQAEPLLLAAALCCSLLPASRRCAASRVASLQAGSSCRKSCSSWHCALQAPDAAPSWVRCVVCACSTEVSSNAQAHLAGGPSVGSHQPLLPPRTVVMKAPSPIHVLAQQQGEGVYGRWCFP